MSMQRIRWYGPSLVLLVTVLLVMVAGPGVARRLAYEHKSAQIQVVRQELAANPSLTELSEAFKAVAKVVEPSVVHVQVFTREARGRRSPQAPMDEDFFRRFFGPRGLPPELLPPEVQPDTPERDAPPDMDRYNVPQAFGAGSGWVYDREGHIITNFHVVEGADKITVRFHDGAERSATLRGADPKTDIAVLKVAGEGLHPATISEDAVEQGEIVFAFGSPFGFKFSMSQGIVSAIGRKELGILRDRQGYENFIQTDAAINPGNSGGPLTNVLGEVVGMNTAIATRTGAYNGLGFAIPADMVRKVARDLIEKGKVSRGYLGIFIRDLNEGMARTFGFEGQGVLVENPIESGPAAEAGLRRGDIITHVAGRAVTMADDLRNTVADIAPGTKVKVDFFREGKRQQVELTVGLMPDEVARAAAPGEAVPQDQGMEQLRQLGLENVADMSEDLARRLRMRFVPGVAVMEVRLGSVAASEGLARGAIITDVMGRKVASVAELVEELGRHDLKKGVRLSVRVGDQERFVFLSLPQE